MILNALAYVLIVSCEVYYMKQRNVSIKPYMILYVVMLIISEALYFYREQFQLIQIIKMIFAPLENFILLR